MNIALTNIDFEPLTEVKAKLSEKIKRLERAKRLLAVTVNGKPRVLLVPYSEFVHFIEGRRAGGRRWSLAEWEREAEKRKAVTESIKNLFDFSSLPRKGQKPYKRNALKKLK